MSLRIQNHGGSSQTRGAWFTLPIARAESLGPHVDLSSGEVAHRVHDDGRKALYSVTGTWPTSNTTVTLSTSAYADEDAFDLHPAYGTADCGTVQQWDTRFIPRVYKVVGGVETEMLPNIRQQAVTLRMDSPYMKEVITSFHFNGFHLEQSLRLWSGEALGEVVTAFYWSDETATSWTMPCDRLVFKYGHEVQGQFWVHTNEKWTLADGGRSVYLDLNFTSSTESQPGNTRLNWQNRLFHGRILMFRGMMFGRAASTVPGDEAIFAAADTLRAHGDGTEWAGGWGYSGRVPPVPSNSSYANAITGRQPAYGTTNRHYVTWNRGTGHDDTNDLYGQVPALYRGATSQGGLGMVFGAPTLHGYTDVWDNEVATGDWCLRCRWVNRDNTYPVPTTQLPNFFTRAGYPWTAQGSTLFGRSNETNMITPYGNTDRDHPDDQHTSSGPLWPYYMLSMDYLTKVMMEQEVHLFNVDGNRSDPYFNAFPESGNRAIGRTINSFLQIGKACPELYGLVHDSLYGFAGWAEGSLARLAYVVRPPTTTSSLGTTYNMYSSPDISNPNTYNGQVYSWNCDPMFIAIGSIGLWQSWLQTGNNAYKDAYEKVMTSALLHFSVYLTSSYSGYGYEGWWLPYNFAASPDGQPLPEAIRTSTHARFAEFCPSAGGEALRRWGYGGIYLYAQVGQNAAAVARARQCLRTMLHGASANPPVPQSWGMSNRSCAAI